MKAREVRMASCCNCEVAVRMTEKKLTPHIICTELILCTENSSFCHVDVKASNVM